MNFTLHCGHYQPELESAFRRALSRLVDERADPLREQVVAVSPTRALRLRLLELASEVTAGLYGVEFASIHPLCREILRATLRGPARIVSDPLYFASLIQKLAAEGDLLSAHNFRICRAVYLTIRDLQDGLVTPSLMQEVQEAAQSDPELRKHFHPSWFPQLVALARRFEESLEAGGIVNLPLATRQASECCAEFVRSRRITSLLLYGFYDATESQFAVLENLARAVAAGGGAVHAFFPFPVEKQRVEHPYGYSQPFLDRMFSLCASLDGTTEFLSSHEDAAGGGLERDLFVAGTSRCGTPPRSYERGEQMDLFAAPPLVEPGRSEPRVEIASAAGDYDEAWGVAKKILELVLEGAAFDQILIIARSTGAELVPLLHVLRENHIPFRIMGGTVLASSPYTKFAALVLEARESGLAPAVLMELLSSPFLPRLRGNDFRLLADLMENLVIRSWEDWDRLDPLLQEGSLPQFYQFLEDRDPVDLQSLRGMVQRIQELKATLLQIPDRAPLPVFASALKQTLEALAREEDEGAPLTEMLTRVAGYHELDRPELSLAGFTDVFRMYVQETARDERADEGVLVADIMQSRGTTAEYTFVMGLNRDVFPRRTQEDPFLPDDTRRILREVTGAGPYERRPRNLLPLKEGTDEELLLFALALRTARKKMYLSFRRADEAGRKAAISNYLDELLRLLTGKTSENNERIVAIPRHHASKFTRGVLPTLTECAALPALYSPEEWLRHCGLPERHADHIRDFGSRLNHTLPDASRALDGIIEDAAAFWRQQQPEKSEITLSYSRLKQYLQCPFQFFARNLLQLQESPRDTGDEDHDLDARLKGRMAEDVAKVALEILRAKEMSIEAAVDRASKQVHHRYAPLLPPVLLDVYMTLFRAGAVSLLRHLERAGYDLSVSETPQYEHIIRMELLAADRGLPALFLRGIPDLLLRHRNGTGLIGELKWGTRSTGKTAGAALAANEAQFCMYPGLVRANGGGELPFRYMRLDAYASFGDPDELARRVRDLPVTGSIRKENAVRTFGFGVEFQDAAANLEKLMPQVMRLREGNFRILKDPSLQYGACRNCSFTQVCRRSHTETLLRAKQAERA